MMATQATKDRASQEGVNAWRTVDLGSYNPVHSPLLQDLGVLLEGQAPLLRAWAAT